jgi:fluoroquinolone resistance protein
MGIATYNAETFQNKSFSAEDISHNEFANCTFNNCDLSNRSFNSGIFSGIFIDCVFDSSNLAMAKLLACQLNNVTFKTSKLLGVNFADCEDSLFTVAFQGCILDYCSFVKKKMIKTSFSDCSMKNTDFTECDLTEALFSNSNLMHAVFYKTLLKKADFTSAANFIIDPETNSIKKAKFTLNGLAGLLNKYDIVIE